MGAVVNEDVEIWRAGSATDDYGDTIPGVYAKHLTLSGKFAPNNPAEPVEVGRNAVITGGTVYVRDLSSVPDVRATDRAKIRGIFYEIDGKVGAWRRSSSFAVQFAVKAVDG